MTKEQKFYNALRDIFVGAKIEGEGGFVNLMRIKSGYYSKIQELLEKDIAEKLKSYPKFKEELFDKLYSFFSRYFTRSGSIYFNQTPFYHNVYEKVYTDEKDVILFWKTRMLYYVKSDRIFKNLEVAFDNYKFFFDVSKLEHKRANEKRSLVYQFKNIRKDDTIVFEVFYSEKGKITKIDEIKKELKKRNIRIKDEDLERAFRTFEKQSEVDYFINKNAKEFLKEQFKIWLYQYVYAEESEWPKERIDQLQILKDIANKIIDFIGQFENELVKIWNKPKFVRNSNYVITLDRINDKQLVEKIRKHKNFPQQVKEWKELGIDKNNPHAPIDTKYFKDLELEILGQFDDLDKSLDGWLIKSENYQALNTILPKFRERVQTIYIDPPFNKKTDADYFYSVKYKDATWVSLLENRLEKAKDLLNEKGSIFVRCDYNGNMLVRLLMDKIFGQENFRNEMILKRTAGLPKREFKNMEVETEYLTYYARDAQKLFFNQLWEDRSPQWMAVMIKYNRGGPTGSPIVYEGRKYHPPEGYSWAVGGEVAKNLLKEGRMRIRNNKPEILIDKRTVGSNWSDIPGYSSPSRWGFSTENHEKLLKRTIETSSNESDIVMDFFLGIGTTIAVAHKLRRKWIGVEIGEHFYKFETKKGPSGILVRMKEILAGKGNHEPCGISKDIKWQGGGFFKYYELEQYEDVLRKAKYEESTLFEIPDESPYQFNPFIKDKKLLEKTLEIDYKNNKVKVDLSKLYPDIDIAETLSIIRGKYIKKITEDEVELEDGEKINLKDLDYKLIKPLIWW